MDFSSKKPKANPYAKSNIFSKIFFLWILPLFWKGYRRDLTLDDMFDTLKDDESKGLGDQLEKQWRKQLETHKKTGQKPSLGKALWGVLGWKYSLVFLGIAIPELIFRVAQPLVLRELLLSFNEDSGVSTRDQYLLAGAVSLATFGVTTTLHPVINYSFVIAMRCRIACSSLLYRKELRLSKSAQGKTTVGQITNLLSNDVNRFDLNLLFIPWIPTSLLQMAIFTVFLWREFGVACLTGLSIVLLLIPIQYWNGSYSAKCRLKIAQRTDERGRIMNEIIIAMKIIKQYTWEKPFSAVIYKLRELEVQALTKRSHLRGFYLSMYTATLKIVVFLTVLTYVLQDNEPTADKVFFLVSIYFTIIQSMIYMIPQAISGLGEIMVSLTRLENFLLLDEKSGGDNLILSKNPERRPVVSMDSLSATWVGEKMNLSDINLRAEGDKVVVIAGAVGSGKTSLLHVLLGELPTARGKCQIQGEISYASQEPWVFAGDVKQNILFGRPFDEEKYKAVVKAAALEDDFKQLDLVNLARCLYQNADIYLLDDPLSAVDTKVSRHLFEKCIREHLSGKLRILVTHQLQYLPQADHVVILHNGTVAAQGTYGELVDAGVDFVNLMTGDDEDAAARKGSEKHKDVDLKRLEESREMHAEKKATGALGSGIYWEYLKTADSPIYLFLVTIFFLMCQFCLSGVDFWLSFWTNAEAKHRKGDENDNYLGRNVYIYVFTGLVGGVILFSLLRAVGFFIYCMKISVNMHNRMFTSLVRAPSKFFDDNPSGRVMNRFTKDLGSMDEQLPPTFFDMIMIFVNVLGVFVLIVISNYYAIVPTVIVLALLVLVQRFYLTTARDIKRIEGVTKSPIFTHTSASFQGLTTIRSAQAESILISQFDSLQDIHTTSWFLFFSSARCFGIWVEVICVIFLTVVSFGFLLLQSSSDSGNLGLAITSAMSITGWLQFGMTQAAEVENIMTSVERNLEYANLEPEASLESKPDKLPPPKWPTSGEIRFSKVYLSYDEKDVLKNLSFDIRARQKIGVVGRTGAGKSSIIQALFRLTEPRGDIYIDGINVKEIGLHDLRRIISIIPQDPVLFSGTMRYNLDPFNEFLDEDLWKVIEEVELKSAVPALDYLVADAGSNFSLGQRQLVCLARAILRNNKIIVMDEATANVDPQTDNLIQKTIRTKFADCSIITVAHRLHSVIDTDRILVLDNGFVKEYDHPHILLQDPSGILTSMVQHTGKSSSALLRNVAAETFNKRRASFQADIVDELSSLNDDNSRGSKFML
ncbi:Multidrug resistance-associated protein 4 [Orchesella cincta]|uniref:Multidrug resistance-associated protein 4 n=1 Tax=Orchesella cincta TaxID=48709 RepID=A0A1D2N5L0_ORCCI|nr:Multidrug resistance-associated protein 4 [Orchesella cincta]